MTHCADAELVKADPTNKKVEPDSKLNASNLIFICHLLGLLEISNTRY
jgi:hypothetical protein